MLLFWGLAVLVSLQLCTGLCGRLELDLLGTARLSTQSNLLLVMTLALRKLIPFGLGALLVWMAVFHPGRRYPAALTALKHVVMVGALLLAAALLHQKAVTAGTGARLLAEQTSASVGAVLAAGTAPHLTVELLGLAPMLVAPLFTFLRAWQVGSLQRSSFEAWVELRRRALPWALLLIVAALVEVFVTPTVISVLLR